MYRGITKVIRTLLAPKFKYSKLHKRVVVKHGLRRRAALMRGKKIDKELGDFFEKNIPCTLMESKAVSSFLKGHDYRFLHAQYHVTSTCLRIQTKIDLLMTKEEKTFLVEVKSGSASRYCKTKPMTFLYGTSFDDCLFHQHQLQCVFSKYMYMQNNPNVKVSTIEMLLIYTDAKGQIEAFSSSDFLFHNIPPGMIEMLQKKNTRKSV